jgi:SAM-dependent MidA family methyltransferase
VRFDEFVDRALYGEGGFYASGRGAGRRADFLTSPEVGPLFGAVIARALASWGFSTVVEAGGGRGTLAKSIKAASDVPLDYVELEFGDAMSAEPFTGVILANELLDNIPFRLFERGESGWLEVYVDDGREVLVPAELELAVDAPVGARVPVQERAAAWARHALSLIERGRLVLIDYTDTTASLARRPWTEWVRTYRGHGRGGHPLDNPGEQDVTCEVAIDQLPPPTNVSTQADFLRAHGIDDLTDAARAAWQERAHIGDLEALKHRSRLSEAAALTDPAGLGAFTVMEWIA